MRQPKLYWTDTDRGCLLKGESESFLILPVSIAAEVREEYKKLDDATGIRGEELCGERSLMI